MPISGTTLVRSTAFLLLVGLLSLLAIVGTTIWLGERTQVYFNQVVEAREARTAAVDLRNSLQVAETSQRGYLLTLDERYLAPYAEAQGKVMAQYERLRLVLLPYPQATEAVAHLQQALSAKLGEMAQTLELARANRLTDAVEVVRTDRGKALMDEAQLLFSGVINAADRRSQEGVIEQRNSASALRWVTILGAIVILAVVGGSAWTVLHYTGELTAARSELQGLNEGLEERVRERTADLGRANEEIQRFAYIVTHDLRAPLVNVMGFTSELEASLGTLQSHLVNPRTAGAQDDGAADEEARRLALEDLEEAIGFIRSSTRKMDALINAILKLSREGRRTLKPERVELSKVVEASAEAVQHQVSESGGEIEVDIALPPIVSDRLSLEQIFGNLLDNAVKYGQAGRPLKVAVSASEAPGNRVVVEVTDNGRGIAPQDHERVFELFRRSGAQDRAGEGIGLAHVRTMARSLGGDVTLSSTLGQGTTFKVSLPRDVRTAVGKSAA